MAEAVRFGRRRALEQARQEERQLLLEGMQATRAQLNHAYAQFNFYSDPDLVDACVYEISDPDLVDACVYEINALQSRYSYYVRQVKQFDAREGAG